MLQDEEIGIRLVLFGAKKLETEAGGDGLQERMKNVTNSGNFPLSIRASA